MEKINNIEQLERTLDKESITFKELKDGILKYKAKSEYKQAAIVIIRCVLEKRLHENSNCNKPHVNCCALLDDGFAANRRQGF